MFGAQRDRYRHLNSYLDRRLRRPPSSGWSLAGVIMGTSVLGLFLFFRLVFGFLDPILVAVINGVLLLSVGVLLLSGGMMRRINQQRKRQLAVERERQVMEVAQRLLASLNRNRIHLDLPQPSSLLLEEMARLWKRGDAALSLPAWESPELGDSWAPLRAQLRLGLDEAMNEGLLIIQGELGSGPHRTIADDIFDNLASGFVFSARPRPDETLSVTFGPLRDLAEKLATLVTEIERTTDSLQTRAGSAPGAHQQIDSLLGELREIREAESELRQNLRG